MNKFSNWVKDLCKIGIYGIAVVLGVTSIYFRFSCPQLTETQLFIYMIPIFLKFGCVVGILWFILWSIKDIK